MHYTTAANFVNRSPEELYVASSMVLFSSKKYSSTTVYTVDHGYSWYTIVTNTFLVD
jgi:hypothetical protein